MASQNIAAKLLSDLKRDFGLTDEQAAGVVGNLMHESGGFNSLQEINPSSGRGGYGYAQWTGPRRTAFENYATRNNLEPSSYEANYGYLKHELANDPYERRQFNTVKNARTAEEAARLVSENFLRPGNPNLASRQNYANQALGYAGSPVPPMDVPGVGEVATALDVRRTAPNPASQAPLMAASRAVTSPSGGNSGLATALQQYATREGNRVVPASVEDRVTARNRAPLMASSAFGDDPGTAASGPVVSTIPTQLPRLSVPSSNDAARRAALSIGGNQTFAGQERMPALAAAAIGRPPTTRVVPTTTIRSGNVSANVNDQRAEQLATRSPARQAVSAIAQDAAKAVDAPQLTQAQKLAIMGTAQREDRLPSEPMLGARALPPIAQPGTESVATLLDTVNSQGLRTTAPAPIQQASIAPIPAQRATPLMAAIAPQNTRQIAPLMASSRPPLNILVDGSNTIQPQTFRGSSTGTVYTPGQVFQTANGPVVVNEGGGFTNQETGRVSGHTVSGGMRYNPDTERHEYVGRR